MHNPSSARKGQSCILCSEFYIYPDISATKQWYDMSPRATVNSKSHVPCPYIRHVLLGHATSLVHSNFVQSTIPCKMFRHLWPQKLWPIIRIGCWECFSGMTKIATKPIVFNTAMWFVCKYNRTKIIITFLVKVFNSTAHYGQFSFSERNAILKGCLPDKWLHTWLFFWFWQGPKVNQISTNIGATEKTKNWVFFLLR